MSRLSQDLRIWLILAPAIISLACSGHDANSNSIARPAGSNSNAGAVIDESKFSFQELEHYGANVKATVSGASSTLDFAFARIGSDRRWAFQVAPPLGQVIYLEKSGLKYLVFPSRGLYTDIFPGQQGFQPAALVTPASPASSLKNQPVERSGIELMNGRTTIKYRFIVAPSSESKSDQFAYLDQETRMPIHAEIDVLTAKRNTTRLVMDVRDLQLNPDRMQFDIPTGMKKVPADQLKPQIAVLVEALRPFTFSR
jgi:hypothetical protein